MTTPIYPTTVKLDAKLHERIKRARRLGLALNMSEVCRRAIAAELDWLEAQAVDAATPFEHRTTIMAERGIAVEQQQVSFHGSTFTHLDALCHISYQGQLYNGVSFQQTVSEAGGCNNLAITTFKDGIVTRGILLDIPRLKGVPYLDAGAKVYIEDVEAWEKKAGIKIGPGDAVFLRTGRWARRAKEGPFANFAGFDASFGRGGVGVNGVAGGARRTAAEAKPIGAVRKGHAAAYPRPRCL